MKTKFELEKNGSYNENKCLVNIIGKQPENPPYLSISVMRDGNEIYHGWMKDKDLERFAVNILKAMKSKKLKNDNR